MAVVVVVVVEGEQQLYRLCLNDGGRRMQVAVAAIGLVHKRRVLVLGRRSAFAGVWSLFEAQGRSSLRVVGLGIAPRQRYADLGVRGKHALGIVDGV